MADTDDTLLSKWDQMQEAADAVEGSDRQKWFSEAAVFLQSTEHWWCHHAPVAGHFAEIFVYHRQPVVQQLWSCMSKQLSACALCVVNYHAAQVCMHCNCG